MCFYLLHKIYSCCDVNTFVCHREMKDDLTQTGDTIAMKVR